MRLHLDYVSLWLMISEWALRASRAAIYRCQTNRLQPSTRLLVGAWNGNVSVFSPSPALNSLKYFDKSSHQTASLAQPRHYMSILLPWKLTVNGVRSQSLIANCFKLYRSSERLCHHKSIHNSRPPYWTTCYCGVALNVGGFSTE